MEMDIENDMVGRIQSLFTGRILELIIDREWNQRRKVANRVPQGSPVSPILFAIYMR